ncbi:MAG: pantetheine-phosphate adenylyltransferase [Bacteroidetes bacterium]|nr:pantetheine-phosphate adenylyltransferase [Bacteroidota bacterium]HNR20054.1 pantetheine-phosphate adenylyltransferase [Bacteroidia bacterium]HNU32645.1 pantetheine-phosphate adenylyltransferase [Bacteroidia bacterium]
MKIAVFPGSFDPLHKGHVEIINKATTVFDKVIVAIGENTTKQYMFGLDERLATIKKVFRNNNRVEVKTYKGLTVDFCKKENANFLVRGLRSSADFEFEKAIAHNNTAINAQVETVFFLASAETSFVTSTIVRELLRNGADVGHLI